MNNFCSKLTKYTKPNNFLFKMRLISYAAIFATIPIFVIFLFQNSFFNHDTLYQYINYGYIFDAFRLTNQIPLWNPYYSYGITTSLTNYTITAPEYFGIFLSKILGSKNSLIFFNLSLIIDCFLYLAGIILILKHLKISKNVIIFSTFIAAITLNPIHQIYFDYQLIIKIPLLIYSIIWLSENIKGRIILFLLFQVSWIYPGSVSYFQIVYFYFSIITFMMVNYKNTNILKENNAIKLTFINNICLAVILLISLSYFLNVKDVILNYHLISPGRQANGDLSYSNFINYGGYTNSEKLVKFFGGSPLTHDFDLFLGLIPMTLSFLPIFYFNKLTIGIKKNWVLLWLLLFILLLFCHPFESSLFHKIIYSLPAINKIRHLGYFITIAKPILIILSAIGLHTLIKNKITKINLLIFQGLSILLLIFLIAFSKLNIHILFFIGFVLTTSYAAEKKWSKSTICLTVLVISSANIVYHKIYEMPLNANKYIQSEFELIHNNSFPFVNRTDPSLSEKIIKFEKILPAGGFGRYGNEVTYIKEDYCYEIYRQDYLFKNIYLDLKNNKLNFNPSVKEFNENENQRINNRAKYGCNRPKIELLPLEYLRNSTNNVVNLSSLDYQKFKSYEFQSNFNLIKFTPNEINFNASNEFPIALPLIYYDSFHPYWEGFVDGKKIEIYQFNGGFKGIYLANGAHNVTFRIKGLYIAFEIIKALLLSVMTIVILFICVRNINNSNNSK